MNGEEGLETESIVVGVQFLNDEQIATAFLRDWTQVIGIDGEVDAWIRDQTWVAKNSNLRAALSADMNR